MVDDFQGIGQQPQVVEPEGRQQLLDDVLDAGTQNGQRNIPAAAPMGKGWKRWVYFDLPPQKIQDLTEVPPDGGHFGRDAVAEGYFSAGDLAADVLPKLHASKGLRQQIDGVGVGDGPVEVAEDGHATGWSAGGIHGIQADEPKRVCGADRSRPPGEKSGSVSRSGTADRGDK